MADDSFDDFDFGIDEPEDGKGNSQVADDELIEIPEFEETIQVKPEAQEEGESDTDYSQRVKKRIAKEVTKTYQERMRAEAAERELQALRAQLQARETQTTVSEKEAQRQAARAELRRLRESFEEDDQRKADELEEMVAELTFEIIQAKKTGAAVAPPAMPNAAPGITPDARQPQRTAADDWIEANSWYQTNPAARERADAIFQKLQDEEGMNPMHPAIYRELSKRMQARKTYESPVSGPARGHEGGNGQERGGFTSLHRQAMIAAGKDPNNAQDRKAFMSKLQKYS